MIFIQIKRPFLSMEKKNGNVNSLTESYFRSPCLPGCIKLTGSGTGVTMFSQLAERSKRGNFEQLMITPARSHCYFAKLRSPTNGVPEWCGSDPAVNHESNV